MFLTSVAALSIISITSHHKAYLQHATLILHHSRPAARIIPAPSHQHLSNREHGTKVCVQDLFGNMPVRVKQRSKCAESGKEDEKELEVLRKQIIGVLLAWHSPVSVTLKSGEGSKKLIIRGKEMATIGPDSRDGSVGRLDMALICSILSQAGFIEPSDWDTWVKTAARTPWVTVKGAISLQPAPSKQSQFLSLGIRPMSSEVGSNVLYDEINRLFACSSFGIQENVSYSEDSYKARKPKDGPFKTHGFTNKQLRGGGKGIDRWPMFYIRIDIQDSNMGLQNDVDRLGERTISSLLQILGAMIISFLEENNFRPRAKVGRCQQNVLTKPAAMGTSPNSWVSSTSIWNPEAAHYAYLDDDFVALSRIKTGTSSKSSGAPISLRSPNRDTNTAKGEIQRAKDVLDKSVEAALDLKVSSTTADVPITDCLDETFEWRNPVSGNTVLVNARTGLVIPPQHVRRPASAPSEHSPSALSPLYTSIDRGSYPNGRLTRSLSHSCISPKEKSWSRELLKKWENPVFQTTEESIPQVSLDGPTIETSEVLHGRRSCCTDVDIQKAFTQSSALLLAKLSKQGLKAAKVISQVDKKFILICVKPSSNTKGKRNAELLALVDQHAADERIRVEALLADLKASPTLLPSPLIFDIQAREHRLLLRIAPSFAGYGIVYDLKPPGESLKCKMIVKALPATIAERCRLEPKVLLELLRSEAWKCEEEGRDSIPTTTTCPQRLRDMLNSRACRSAIMFNDELTKEECWTLIKRLGNCAFPFQCAHGRPSMVPLVDLGHDVGASFESERAFGPQKTKMGTRDEGERFGAAWLGWHPHG